MNKDSKIYTEWFPFNIAPFREGFYQVNTPECPANRYSYWNGANWEVCSNIAEREPDCTISEMMGVRGTSWRGLTLDGFLS